MKPSVYLISASILLAAISVGCVATPTLTLPSPTTVPTQVTAIVTPPLLSTVTLQLLANVPPTQVATLANPQFFPTPIPTIVVSQPVTNLPPSPKRIAFPPGGTSATLQGSLASNGMDNYILRALAGQTMFITVSSQAHILLAINGADGDVLKSSGAGIANWSGRLRKTQDYFIRISTEDGEPARYKFEITISPLTP